MPLLEPPLKGLMEPLAFPAQRFPLNLTLSPAWPGASFH